MKPWDAGYVLLVEPQAVGNAIRECAAEIESLRQQLADKHQLFMCASANYDRLAEQLAECEQKNKELTLDAAIGRVPMDSKDFEWEKRLTECERERDSARNMVMQIELRCPTYEELKHQLAECERDRDELVMALHYVKNSVFEDSAAFDIAKTTLAKLGADKTGEMGC